MIKATILIPYYDNDKQPIDSNEIGGKLFKLAKLCGGYTRSDKRAFIGCWVDGNGRSYDDELMSVSVVCQDEQLPAIRWIVAELCEVCRQECICLEWQPIHMELTTKNVELYNNVQV